MLIVTHGQTSDSGPRANERGRGEMNDELQGSIEREVLGWPGVSQEPGRFNSTAYLLGRREIGHVHGNRVVDLPFPRALADELIASGRARPHQAGVRGFVSVGSTPRTVSTAPSRCCG